MLRKASRGKRTRMENRILVRMGNILSFEIIEIVLLFAAPVTSRETGLFHRSLQKGALGTLIQLLGFVDAKI